MAKETDAEIDTELDDDDDDDQPHHPEKPAKTEEEDSNYESENNSHKSGMDSTGRSSPEDCYKLLLAAEMPSKPPSPAHSVQHHEDPVKTDIETHEGDVSAAEEYSDLLLEDEGNDTENDLEPGQCFKVLPDDIDDHDSEKCLVVSKPKRKCFEILSTDEEHGVVATSGKAQGCKHEMLEQLLKEIFMNDECPVSFKSTENLGLQVACKAKRKCVYFDLAQNEL